MARQWVLGALAVVAMVGLALSQKRLVPPTASPTSTPAPTPAPPTSASPTSASPTSASPTSPTCIVADPFIVLIARFVPDHTDRAPTCVKVNPELQGHMPATGLTLLSLQRAGANVWYNPTCAIDRADVVISMNSASDGVNVRRETGADLLLVGPNVIPPEMAEYNSRVDRWIMASEWVTLGHQYGMRRPDLKFNIWPVGVDDRWWTPTMNRTTRGRHALMYLKTPTPPGTVESIEAMLRRLGYTTERIEVRFFNSEQYRAALRRSNIMVAFTQTETQGIFLSEAWSTDVPTFMYAEYGWQHDWEGIIWPSRPSSYLTAHCGHFFNTVQQLQNLVARDYAYEPRAWLLQHMSAEVCGRHMMDDIMRDLKAKRCSPAQTP